MCRGSVVGLARSSSMTGLSANAATMKVGTGIAELAVRVARPVETELFSIGREHGVLALGIVGESGGRFACRGLVCFAVCWEVSGGSAAKAMGA